MVKKVFVSCVLLVFCYISLWAGGRGENESRIADDPAAFQDIFDTSEHKPGKWNFFLEATDRAGNISRFGPENILIDPVSDLPHATIINPMPNMRVQGNLNIVGVAVDDDGVDHVVLTVTRGRDGRGEELVRVRAEGSDYWSYFLDTTDPDIWTDGVYTITAWAVDINGLSGVSEDFHVRQHKKHSVYWHLDRKNPETIVTSHEVGALVSGRLRLRGTVIDGNGINSLSYSLDGGVRYQPVRIREDRRTGDYNWEIDLNTPRIFDDGPAVIWFKAQDGQGSVGNAAHLLFINNTGPDVRIVYPDPEAAVNGIFDIAVYAQHTVGLSSVSWRVGRDGGEFELLPGNNWYSSSVDIRGERTNNIDIEIRAVDVSGNVTVTRQRYRVDQNADLPTITLSEPAVGAVVGEDGTLVVRGIANDDDGVSSIFYSIGGQPEVEIPCSGYFQFIIQDLPEGIHTLEVWAKDITGVIGPRAQVRNIVVPGTPADLRIESFTTGTGNAAVLSPFYTGMTVRLEPRIRTVMEMTVRASAVNAASVTFGDQPAVVVRPGAARDGLLRVTVPVPANLPSGFTEIELKVTDRFGREIVYPEYVFIEQNDPAIPANWAAPGRGFRWIRPNEQGGRILLGSAEEILLGLSLANIPVSRAVIDGSGSENLRVNTDEHGRVILRALTEGIYGPLTVTVDDVESPPFSIIADFNGPRVNISQAPQGWVQTSVPVSIDVSGGISVTSVDFSLDMGDSWHPLPNESSITHTFDISLSEDGAVTILVRAVNEAGRSTMADFTVLKDTTAPEARVIMPFAEARVNGTVHLGFEIKEAGALRSVTYHRPADGEVQAISTGVFDIDNWEMEYAPGFLEVLMDSIEMPLDENMRFVFEDMAGNSSEVTLWDFIIAPEDDIPVVHIILPLEDEVITTDFIVSGIMFDDDGIKQIYWNIDDGTDQIVEAENGFSIPILLLTLTDNDHVITVVAEDIYGVKSEPVTRNFRVSLSEPEAVIEYPTFETVLRDIIEIRGTSFDANGIREVQISVDNGNTFNQAHGTEEWAYQFNSRILEDGPHVVFIRVFDNYDIPATYAGMINIDNTGPEIMVDSPDDGSISIGRLSIMGRVLDPNLEDVTIEIRSLEGAAVSADIRTRQFGNIEVIKEDYDLIGMSDGLYNIEVVATDRAGNITRLSRNYQLARETFRNFVNIYYPLDNENMQGEFNLYGFAGGTEHPGTVTIRINDIDRHVTYVDDSGFYRFSLNSEMLIEGVNTISVHSSFGGGEMVSSQTQSIVYSASGPWVTIDSLTFGDFAFDRPYLTGRFGYELSWEESELLADRSTEREVRSAIQAKVPDFAEISFDNGKTFLSTSRALARDIDYRYRLETGDMVEGIHYILVRATMKNGETAMTRMLVQVDKTPPEIRLISPESGGVYNTAIAFSASATDDVELVGLTYHLRSGDKAAYEVPGFLQGLYIEGIIPPFLRQISHEVPVFFSGGATYMDLGLGLSFFDDNVKIQGQYGFMKQEHYESLGGKGPLRYGGNVFGVKLLANIYTLPLGSVLGPDFDWLSASFTLGANFSLFDIGREGYTQSGEPTWLSAILMQIEFPKVTLPRRTFLRTFSMFTEGQLWFVPTDVKASESNISVVIPHFIIGLRLYVF